MEAGGNERQVLGSIELNGPGLFDESDKLYGRQHRSSPFTFSKQFLITEMPLISHEHHPALILKTKASGVGNIQEMLSGSNQESTSPDPLSTFEKINADAMKAWDEFDYHGRLKGLEQAIVGFQSLRDMVSESDPRLPSILYNLGLCLFSRFQRLGDVVDLHDSIAQIRIAIKLTPEDNPSKPSLLSNLGNCLDARFKRLGNLADIDDAITSNQTAVDLTPHGHPSKPINLNNLGISLETRFQRLGNPKDLDDAILSKQAAVDLTLDGLPEKPKYLNNLGISLETRFQRVGNIADLDNAIISKQASVDLTSDGHPDKPGRLSNLGNSLETRFRRVGDLVDLDRAIKSMELAISLIPDGHPSKHDYVNNLGVCLQARFGRLENLADLDRAIASYKLATDLTPEDHLEKLNRLGNLAGAFWTRYLRLKHPQDCEATFSHFSAAANSPIGSPILRFRAAKAWYTIASFTKHSSLLVAYECAINIIPLVAWLGLPIAGRHQHLVEIGGTTRDAAAAAISSGQYDKALEWLEQGRSIVWTQILQLRTPVDELREVRPDLAERLVQVSRLLEQGMGKDGLPGGRTHSAHEGGRQYRALTAEWESLIEQVRSLPNFVDFLRPLSSIQLKKAAQGGSVVVLNIAEQRCDALALIPGRDHVMHIPLPSLTSQKVTELGNRLKDLLYSGGARAVERAAKKVENETDDEECKWILAELWNCLVKPVLNSLEFLVRYKPFVRPQSLMISSLA
jgi:tetratricopeptide (TPR) repeat protein